MTVAIPEAAAAARAGTARSAARSPEMRPRGGRGAGPPAPRGFARPLPDPPARRQGSTPARPASTRQSSTRRKAPQRSPMATARHRAPTDKINRTNYQPVILAEFVAAVLLVALSPVASKANPDGLSPYAGKDMMKLGAVTGVYFALALVSTGGQSAGRFAAWFGGLILLTVGLSEAAHLASVFDLGGAAKTAASKAVDGAKQHGKTIAGRN